MTSKYNIIVAAAIALWVTTVPLCADTEALDELFEHLRDPGVENWQRVEQDIERAFSLSGSPSADLLLRRGLAAMEAEEYDIAIAHLTALTDHAPDFAEGWHTRATVFFLSGLYGPAIDDLFRTLTLEPRHYRALVGLGIIYEDLGNPERALAAFRAAGRIHPYQPEILEAIERIEHATQGSTL